jgi:hypothetical protein
LLIFVFLNLPGYAPNFGDFDFFGKKYSIRIKILQITKNSNDKFLIFLAGYRAEGSGSSKYYIKLVRPDSDVFKAVLEMWSEFFESNLNTHVSFSIYHSLPSLQTCESQGVDQNASGESATFPSFPSPSPSSLSFLSPSPSSPSFLPPLPYPSSYLQSLSGHNFVNHKELIKTRMVNQPPFRPSVRPLLA